MCVLVGMYVYTYMYIHAEVREKLQISVFRLHWFSIIY